MMLDCDYGLGTLISDMGVYGGGDSVAISVEDITSGLPSKVSLLQNYPNPFNASTTISYSIPEVQHVKLTVYDMLGRKINTIVDEVKSAGNHQVRWNADNYASGVYFARLSSGEFSGNLRLVLIK